MVPWLAYPACTILKFEKLLPCEVSRELYDLIIRPQNYLQLNIKSKRTLGGKIYETSKYIRFK